MVPGDLPAGEYETQWFFGGQMTLTLPDGWTSPEDSTGEFLVQPLADPDVSIAFWEDVYPVEPNTVKRIETVPITRAGLVDWLMANPNLEVSDPAPTTIANDLPATTVDLRVADDAVNDDPKHCPVRACANFLGFPDWEGPYGIAAEPRRFYLSDISYGGSPHLFVIAVAAPDEASLEAFTSDAEVLISTVRVPVSPGLKGCVPACGESDLVAPGDLPAGEYQTQWFFGGEMRVTFDAGWTSPEDSTGEFHATPIENAEENHIFFWEDVYPVENGKRVKGVPLTVAGLLDWMESSTQLEVSAPVRGTIGDLPASVVDVRIADDAVDDDPKNCPFRACALFLGFPQWHGIFGITGPQIQRYYLADVTYGGRDHLFVALIYAATPAVMKTLRAEGERLISTVRVPASPA